MAFDNKFHMHGATSTQPSFFSFHWFYNGMNDSSEKEFGRHILHDVMISDLKIGGGLNFTYTPQAENVNPL